MKALSLEVHQDAVGLIDLQQHLLCMCLPYQFVLSVFCKSNVPGPACLQMATSSVMAVTVVVMAMVVAMEQVVVVEAMEVVDMAMLASLPVVPAMATMATVRVIVQTNPASNAI